MNTRETIVYIGEIDKHYQKLCYETQNDGYTIIQLSDDKLLEDILQILDVFILVVNDIDLCAKDKSVFESVRAYCQDHEIAWLEIKDDIISVEQIHWLKTEVARQII